MNEENCWLCEVELGEVSAEFVSQIGPVFNTDFVYLDISSVDRESKTIIAPKITKFDRAPSRAKQVLQAGDILVSMTRPNLNAVALVPQQLDGAIGSSGFHVLRSKWVSPQFLYYLVQTDAFVDAMNSVVQGALYPAVRPKDISSFKFLLPSSFYQSRIVQKLEELFSDLDAGVAELKAAQKKLVQYRQSLLKAAVEGKLTEQWRNNRYAASPQNLTHQERDTTASETAANTPLSPRGRGVGGEGATTSGLPHNAWLRDRARELRKAQTPQEQALWQQLRAKRFSGFKFRRQQVIGRYITDFVCFEKKLVIELDGSQHSDTKQADAQRDRWLNAQGFRVLRFWNNQWQSQSVGVLEAIWQALHEDKPSPPLPNPSPTRGEGLILTADVDMEGRSGSQPDASFYHDERGAGEAVETGAQLLERILKERRARWEAKQLAKFQEQGKIPPKGWQDKYPEPVKPDTRDLPKLPEGWIWASVDQLTIEQKYGSSSKTNEDVNGVPVLRMGNIQDGELDFTNLKYLPIDHDEFPVLFLQDGDLLFNRSNSPELVGKTAVYRSQRVPCSYASYLISVRFSENYIPELAATYINSAYGKHWIKSVVIQQVGQANVNGTKLSALAIPLPPFVEQAEICSLLQTQTLEIFEQLKSVDTSLKQSAAQRKNILKAAFSGQLVPQDPNDEPASVLLERIRAERAAKQTVKTPKKRTTRSTS